MRQEHWSRVKRLFEAALEKLPTERAAYLEGISELDPDLRKEVERLLGADRDDSFLQGLTEPEISQKEPAESLGDGVPEETRVGPYRLLKEIGRGGMGTVHLAVRDDDEYKKRVAVKLLRKGMDSEDIVRRFRNERQILAAVEHAYIAKLYDGGTTDKGSPYFVMELVEGRPLDEYCDSHRLSIHERLDLFRKVCAAVQVAHQNLVVHRDLKPSNILVTAAGEPKLLDFGIAKLLNPELSAATIDPTRFQLGLMTPAYASPEQVRGEPITTASDVYSLGVILYELLTGHRPYQISGQSLHEVTQVVCEEEPTRPSQMIERQEDVPESDGTSKKLTPETVSRSRGDSADKLRRKLSGDLDNIVMMALRKEPQRRYASVEQVSEDIRRHFEGRPVRARKPTLSYRGSKFIRRHRAGLAAAVLFTVSIVGFMFVTVRARARAEREAVKAQAINEFMQKTRFSPDTQQLLYRAKQGRDRNDSQLIDPMEFVARMLIHIPDPNKHSVHYFGYYSTVARAQRNTTHSEGSHDTTPSSRNQPDPTVPPTPIASLRRRWADLIRRVYEVDPLVCPQCGGEMRVISFITKPKIIRRILDHVKKRDDRSRAPPNPQFPLPL